MAFIPNVKLNNFRSLKEITFEKNNNNEKKVFKKSSKHSYWIFFHFTHANFILALFICGNTKTPR